MHEWLKKHFPRIDRVADRFSYWFGGSILVALWSAMTYAASAFSDIAQHGWGAVVFAGAGMACLLAFAARAVLSIFIYFRPPKSSATVSALPPTAPPNMLGEYTARINQIEVSLLNIIHMDGMRVTKDILRRWIEAAPHIPKDERGAFDIGELQAELATFDEYSRNLESDLSQTIHRVDCRNVISTAEGAADAEVRGMVKIPYGLPPYEFRLWFIARSKACRILDFIIRKKTELDNDIMYDLSKLEEQRRNVQASKDRRR